MEYIIESDNLVKRYGIKCPVDHVSIHVKEGDIYGLIGKNGAGKTSLMKLLLGVTIPNEGTLKLFGSDNLNEQRKKIGSLIETPGLYKNFTAEENLKAFCKLYGVDENEVLPLLAKVGLADTGRKTIKQFSLGMKQRLGIAIALLGNPKILVLDEPINGLDPTGIKEVRDLIMSLNAEGITILISSHLLDELSKIATTYGIIRDGKLVEEVSADEIDNRCGQNVKIVPYKKEELSKIAKAIKEYDDSLDLALNGDYIVVSGKNCESARLNEYIVKNNFLISQIITKAGGFEDYFINRLG